MGHRPGAPALLAGSLPGSERTTLRPPAAMRSEQEARAHLSRWAFAEMTAPRQTEPRLP